MKIETDATVLESNVDTTLRYNQYEDEFPHHDIGMLDTRITLRIECHCEEELSITSSEQRVNCEQCNAEWILDLNNGGSSVSRVINGP